MDVVDPLLLHPAEEWEELSWRVNITSFSKHETFEKSLFRFKYRCKKIVI